MSDDLPFFDDPPSMYFLLKKQSASHTPSDSIGTLLKLWQDLENICETTTNMPVIKRNSGFTFGPLINDYIKSGKASILMLINYETKAPCAVLVFTYIPKEYLYIDYLDGDKHTKQCGGGATYLLWHFCKCVDNITEPRSTIPIKLMDAADRPNYYDALFGNKDNHEYRDRTSMSITDNYPPQPPALTRQRSLLQPNFQAEVFEHIITPVRGLDKVNNLRNCDIIYDWNFFTGDIGAIQICDSIELSMVNFDDQIKLSIFNDMLIRCCKNNNYSSAIRYLETVFIPFDKGRILNYIRKKYPPSSHMWSHTFLDGVANSAGKIRIKTRKRKGYLKSRALKTKRWRKGHRG